MSSFILRIYKQAWGPILILLLLANSCWLLWNVWQHAVHHDGSKQFRVEVLHTNGMQGVGLFEAKTGDALWTRFASNGQVIMENHFYRGRDILDVTLKAGRPPVYNFFFPGLGKSVTWWFNAGGSDTFTERVFYGTNGDLVRTEVWYDAAWHPIDRRNEKNGIIVNGHWRQLGFDTNGMWRIETTNMPRSDKPKESGRLAHLNL